MSKVAAGQPAAPPGLADTAGTARPAQVPVLQQRDACDAGENERKVRNDGSLNPPLYQAAAPPGPAAEEGRGEDGEQADRQTAWLLDACHPRGRQHADTGAPRSEISPASQGLGAKNKRRRAGNEAFGRPWRCLWRDARGEGEGCRP